MCMLYLWCILAINVGNIKTMCSKSWCYGRVALSSQTGHELSTRLHQGTRGMWEILQDNTRSSTHSQGQRYHALMHQLCSGRSYTREGMRVAERFRTSLVYKNDSGVTVPITITENLLELRNADEQGTKLLNATTLRLRSRAITSVHRISEWYQIIQTDAHAIKVTFSVNCR